MEGKQFWEVEYTDYVEGVTIKFKKMNSLDVLDLADRNLRTATDEGKQFKLDCLRNVVWTKDGKQWFDLMDESGNCTLAEMPLATMLDIFFEFRNKVCLPVFTESRTYRLLTPSHSEQDEKDKKRNS